MNWVALAAVAGITVCSTHAYGALPNPVTTFPYPLSTSDNSGTVITGGTFQQLTASNANRASLEFDNVCTVSGNCTNTSDVCYIFFGTTANASKGKSIIVPAGWTYLRSSGAIPNDAVQGTCDNTSDKFRFVVQ